MSIKASALIWWMSGAGSLGIFSGRMMPGANYLFTLLSAGDDSFFHAAITCLAPAPALWLKALPSVLCCCAQMVFNIDPRAALPLLLFSFLFASLKGLAKWIKINEQKYSLSGILAIFTWHVAKCGKWWRFVSWWLFLPFRASALPSILCWFVAACRKWLLPSLITSFPDLLSPKGVLDTLVVTWLQYCPCYLWSS